MRQRGSASASEVELDDAKEDEALPPGLLMPTLHAAAALGIYSTVKSIVVLPLADPNAPEPLLGRRPLHLAASGGQLETVRLLLEQPSPRWLYWLVGSALSPADLARAGAEHAAAALVVNEVRARTARSPDAPARL